MSSFRIRPRFSHTVDFDATAVRDKIAAQVAQGQDHVELKCFPDYLCLRIPEKHRHFWSPRLNLSLEPQSNGQTRIHGIYGPNGNVWALYLYGYLIVGSLGVFSSILGFCRWKLGKPAWGLWVFAFALIAATTLYILAQFGQKLAAYQTYQLHKTYESAMERPVEIY